MCGEGCSPHTALFTLSMNTPLGVFMVSVQDPLGCQNLMVRSAVFGASRTMRPRTMRPWCCGHFHPR
jgi:hypothetical protein